MNRTGTKQCGACSLQFFIPHDDVTFYEKLGVPQPTLCPSCRYQRRIANRNEWNFYKRECDLCKKGMISIYDSEYTGPVYCQRCYRSDDWDPLKYGRDFDFSRTFFEQYRELRSAVPRVTLTHDKSVNCEYTNQAQNNKNCYMVVASNYAEDCLYGNWLRESRQCIDCYNIESCELLYESMHCTKCYRSAFLENCYDCVSGFFLKDCRGCQSCFGCIGMRNKSHCWFNEQLDPDAYAQRIAEFSWTVGGIIETRKKTDRFSADFPRKYYQGRNNVHSTGDYIEDTKETRQAFNCKHTEDIAYCQDAWNAKVERDLTETAYTELDYEIEGCAYLGRCIVMSKSWNTSDSAYCELTFDSNNLFGCMSLRKKSYCILNKQYSKGEYQDLREKIIGHMRETGEWGEFFPVEISPFPYNVSIAQDYFPLEKSEILNRGWKWHERDAREYKITLEHQDVPEKITGVPETITDETISCSSQDSEEEKKEHIRCATAFRIHPEELSFYKRMGLPIPHRCFPCRLQDRLNRRNPRELWSRTCICAGTGSQNGMYINSAKHTHEKHCPNVFETSYSPERKEIVYCEECYNKEIS